MAATRRIDALTRASVLLAALVATATSSARASNCPPDGVFGLRNVSPLNITQRHIEVADLNHDGIPDLVISTRDALAIALGARSQANPDVISYTFLESHPMTGLDPQGSAIADFDGDGLLDVAVSCDQGGVVLFRGLGGQVQPYASLPTGSTWDLGAGDVNGDGIVDLVVGTRAGTLQVWLGNATAGHGNGLFTLSVEYGSAGKPKGLSLVDLDGDGVLDVVLATEGSSFAVHRGMSSGGVPNGAFEPVVVFSATGLTYDVAVADFNGDGRLDVATADYVATSVSVALRGTGLTFSAPHRHLVPGSPLGVVAGDFDRDGHVDLAASAAGNNYAFTLLLNSGDYSGDGDGFGDATSYGPGRVSSGITAADLNGDGSLDVVVPSLGDLDVYAAFSKCLIARRKLTTSVVGLGAIAREPNLSDYAPGDTVKLTGIPAAGQHFVAWSGSVTGKENPIRVVMTFDKSVVATFVTGKKLVTSVVGSGTLLIEPNLPDYTPGDTVRITAVPGPHYRFGSWSGLDYDEQPTNPLVLEMERDRNITATFLPIFHRLPVSFAGVGLGSVSRSPDASEYFEGTSVTLTAHAGFASVFRGWSGDTTSTDSVLVLSIDGDRSVVATFDADATRLPHILSVTDVPLDEGGRVKLRWRASSIEGSELGFYERVTHYYIWHEIPQAAHQAALGARPGGAAPGAAPPNGIPRVYRTHTAAREFAWEFVTSLPTGGFTEYSYTAATTSDSTKAGNPFTAFLVQARTETQGLWYDSEPDSGYSVDNLAPGRLGNLVAEQGAFGNRLRWGRSSAPDVRNYEVHRAAGGGFTPGPENWLADAADTAYTDASGPAGTYQVAAVDAHGNRGPLVELRLPRPAPGAGGGALALAIEAVYPNPAPAGRLGVLLVLPDDAPATLELLDLSGRRVLARALAAQAGRQRVDLGAQLSPGLYWVRLRQRSAERVVRAAVLD